MLSIKERVVYKFSWLHWRNFLTRPKDEVFSSPRYRDREIYPRAVILMQLTPCFNQSWPSFPEICTASVPFLDWLGWVAWRIYRLGLQFWYNSTAVGFRERRLHNDILSLVVDELLSGDQAGTQKTLWWASPYEIYSTHRLASKLCGFGVREPGFSVPNSGSLNLIVRSP